MPCFCHQVYFRYPSPAASDGDQRSASHQLVQCVYKKTSYPSPIQVPDPPPPLPPPTPTSRLTCLIFVAPPPAPEGGGHQVLGPGRRVRPALRLPGGALRAAGRRRDLRVRVVPDDGQRRRLLQLLRRLPARPLRGRRRGGGGGQRGSGIPLQFARTDTVKDGGVPLGGRRLRGFDFLKMQRCRKMHKDARATDVRMLYSFYFLKRTMHMDSYGSTKMHEDSPRCRKMHVQSEEM